MHPLSRVLIAATLMLVGIATPLHAAEPDAPTAAGAPMSVTFAGNRFLHRWSKGSQHEFTPQGQEDLARWTDMVTINVHPTVRDSESLAKLANAVLARYQELGTLLRTDSIPASESRPAEHLVVVVFSTDGLVEASFARFVLVDGTGYVVNVGRRSYGAEALDETQAWLRANGEATEAALMGWKTLPAANTLQALPASN